MAKNPKRDKTEILTRTETWPLAVTEEQEKLLVRISDGLRDYYNWALEVEHRQNEAYRAAQNSSGGSKPNIKRFFSEIDLYNEWKAVRQEDIRNNLFRGTIPANWVLETFKSDVGAYKSFFALVKNGDPDARTPKERPEWRFQAVPGCSAFSIKRHLVVSGDRHASELRVVLAPEIFGRDTLSFPIPPGYQARMLARSKRDAKFIISRDEPNLNRPGRFWISVSYEIPKPETLPFVPEEAVFVSLGASSIGIVSPKGEEIIKLWRSDRFWKPRIDTVERFLGLRKKAPIKRGGSKNIHPPLTRGSKVWRQLHASYTKMNRIMADQQTQNRREIVASLIGIREIAAELEQLESREQRTGLLQFLHAESTGTARISRHGVHFVVTDYVVRSKEGKLADSGKPERSGLLGLNWGAQNSGTIGYIERWLEAKVPEFGGAVHKHRLSLHALPSGMPVGHENKILMAQALRDDFLKTLQNAA